MTSRKQQLLRKENARLREAIRDLSKRQQVLEEFIDLEYPSDHLKLFEKNRDRMMFALGYNSIEDIRFQLENGGKRSPKSLELVRLLRVVKRYQRPPDEKKRKRRLETQHPIELQPHRIFINTNTGVIERRPPKRCEKCYDPDHIHSQCPYKYEAARTPEVKAMIKARVDEIAVIELNDPFLSKKYKQRHFKGHPEKKARVDKFKKRQEEYKALKNVLDSSFRGAEPGGSGSTSTG